VTLVINYYITLLLIAARLLYKRGRDNPSAIIMIWVIAQVTMQREWYSRKYGGAVEISGNELTPLKGNARPLQANLRNCPKTQLPGPITPSTQFSPWWGGWPHVQPPPQSWLFQLHFTSYGPA